MNITMFRVFVIIGVGLLSLPDVAQAKPRILPEGVSIYKTSMSWWDANRTCLAEGAKLASPINDNALSGMKSLFGTRNVTYFIGLHALRYPGPFLSVEGVSLENMPPSVLDMVESIEQWDGENCLAMNSDSIRAVPCWSELPFICNEKPLCGLEEGYTYEESQRKCYKVHPEEMAWDEAENTCVSEGAHLVVLDDTNEAQAVRALFKSDWTHIWTGLRGQGSFSDWKSVIGKPIKELYNRWHEGYDTNGPNICAAFWNDLDLVRKTCDEKKFSFICEKPY